MPTASSTSVPNGTRSGGLDDALLPAAVDALERALPPLVVLTCSRRRLETDEPLASAADDGRDNALTDNDSGARLLVRLAVPSPLSGDNEDAPIDPPNSRAGTGISLQIGLPRRSCEAAC